MRLLSFAIGALLTLSLATETGRSEEIDKRDIPGIYNQVKKSVAIGHTWERTRNVLSTKGWLEGPRRDINLEKALEFYRQMRKNAASPYGSTKKTGPISMRSGGSVQSDIVPETEPNDDPSSATPIMLGDTGRGEITANDVDYWGFSVSRFTGVTLSVLTEGSGLDPQMRLLDQNLIELGFDDDDGPLLDSRLVTVVPPGTYFVSINAFNDATIGTYDLVTSGTETLVPIGGRELVDGEISAQEPVTFFAFEAPEEADLALSAHTLGSGLDSRLVLADAQGGILFEDDDSGSGTDARVETRVPSGNYFAAVESFDGTGSGTFLYQNQASPSAIPNAHESEPNDIFDEANLSQCCQIVEAAVGKAGDFDFYFFSVSRPTRVIAEANAVGGSNLDSQIFLFDANRVEIEFDDDSGPMFDARIEKDVPAGDYFLLIRGFQATVGDYELTFACAASYTPNEQEAEPNDDSTTANDFLPGDDVAGDISTLGDSDFYRLEIHTSIQLSLFVTTPTSDLDPQIRVLSFGGSELFFDDDGGEDTDSALRHIFLETGIYFVEVSAFADTSTGTYELIADSTFVRPGVATGGDETAFTLTASHRDLFFILTGDTEALIQTRFGNQLIDPARFVLITQIPPCGVLTIPFAIDPVWSGSFFLTQAISGSVSFEGAYFTNRLRVDIQ